MLEAKNHTTRIAVIGGGITGLSAAYYLQKQIQEKQLGIDVTLLESSSRVGGKILTDTVHNIAGSDDVESAEQPFIVEAGPDCFLTQKPWAVDLALELDMADRLMGTNDDQRKVYVLNKGRPTPLPDGVLLIVPTKFTPFALSPLISPLGKLRMGMDLFISAKTDDEDETLAQFITRRLGNEALDKIAEPLMSGIYNAEADRQSVMATFPRFRAIEKQHGSLIRGMLASRKARTNNAPPKPMSDGKRPKTVFATLKDGTAELTDELARRLDAIIHTDTTVTKISTDETGGYRLSVAGPDGENELTAEHILLTTPAFVSAELLREVAPEAAQQLGEIRYVSTGTISLAYRSEDLQRSVDGFGLVIPHSENRPINAITFSSTKFDHRAPSGYRLVRVFFGGSRSPESMELDDDGIFDAVRQQLVELLDITAEPIFHRIYRWNRANPQYDIGHLDRVAAIEQLLPANILVTGSPYRGVGIPDCVHQAKLAVESLCAKLVTAGEGEPLAPAELSE